jgi:hypothetical protein
MYMAIVLNFSVLRMSALVSVFVLRRLCAPLCVPLNCLCDSCTDLVFLIHQNVLSEDGPVGPKHVASDRIYFNDI